MKVQVALYTVPLAPCDSGRMNWSDVSMMLRNQLRAAFGDAAGFEHKEFMSPEWFTDDQAQKLLESGQVSFPFVLVNGEIACSDKKVNVSKVRRCVQSLINS